MIKVKMHVMNMLDSVHMLKSIQMRMVLMLRLLVVLVEGEIESLKWFVVHIVADTTKMVQSVSV